MALCLLNAVSTAFCNLHGDCVKFAFSELWLTESLAARFLCLSQCHKWLYSFKKRLHVLFCNDFMGKRNRIITTHDWPYLTQSHRISAHIYGHTLKNSGMLPRVQPSAVLSGVCFNVLWLALISPEIDWLLTTVCSNKTWHTNAHAWVQSWIHTHLANPLPLCPNHTNPPPESQLCPSKFHPVHLKWRHSVWSA